MRGAALEWGVPDPFARKTYLHAVPDAELSVRFSLGKRTRALQMQGFLKTLGVAEEVSAEPPTRVELLVLTPSDWRRLLSAPYGWALARRSAEAVTLLVPAIYPPRLIVRWDAVRLRAAQAGVRAPGGVGAWCDAQVGLEWAHALLLSQQRGRAPKAWVREVMAAYLYQKLLHDLDASRLDYLNAWAHLQQAGARPSAYEAEAFSYPRAKMPFDDLLWTQSALWLRSAALGEQHGWALPPAEMRSLLKTQT